MAAPWRSKFSTTESQADSRRPSRTSDSSERTQRARSLHLTQDVYYKLEAENQDLFARYYEGHPFVHIPEVVRELSTERVLTSELLVGKRFDELQAWNQHERDLAAEAIYRFVFSSLYRL